jgi:hypothetical protein
MFWDQAVLWFDTFSTPVKCWAWLYAPGFPLKFSLIQATDEIHDGMNLELYYHWT